jgi:hypothetical protein
MGAKIRCLKCGDIIESKHVHDFKFCKCENIFIDGGNNYTRYGGLGLEDESFEFIDNCFYGVISTTKIGLFRDIMSDDMYIDIYSMYMSKRPYKIYCATQSNITTIKSIKMNRSEEKLELYKYHFSNNCSFGKLSFGTEDYIITTPNCPVLKNDGTYTTIDKLDYGDELLSIKRNSFNEIVSNCKSTLIFKHKYYNDYVYNFSFNDDLYICANGMFIGCLKE